MSELLNHLKSQINRYCDKTFADEVSQLVSVEQALQFITDHFSDTQIDAIQITFAELIYAGELEMEEEQETQIHAGSIDSLPVVDELELPNLSSKGK